MQRRRGRANCSSVPGDRIAVIAHGFFNRALASVLLNLSPAETMRIRQANDIVIRVTTDAAAPVDHFINGQGPVPGLPEAAAGESA